MSDKVSDTRPFFQRTAKALPLLATLAAFAGCVMAGPVRAQEHEVLRGRLVFADHERPVVRVLDLDTGKVSHTFAMPKPRASLVAAEGGRFVVILTGDDKGTVRILDTGLVFEEHGDHRDVEKRAVRLLKVTLTGDRPAHVGQ